MDVQDVIAALTRDPSRTGVFSDFDGTLAPIVARPEDATALPGTHETLSALAGRFAVVGVISGRSLDDLRARMDAPGVVLAASYGLERSDRGAVAPGADWEALAAEAERSLTGVEGVVVERKSHGVALHYRTAPAAAAEVRKLAHELESAHGLVVRAGRLVSELTEPGPDKGDALAALAGGLATFLFAGDDVADLEAFRRARSLDAEAICLAVVSAESPPELGDTADIVFGDQRELLDLLRTLVGSTAPRPG